MIGRWLAVLGALVDMVVPKGVGHTRLLDDVGDMTIVMPVHICASVRGLLGERVRATLHVDEAGAFDDSRHVDSIVAIGVDSKKATLALSFVARGPKLISRGCMVSRLRKVDVPHHPVD